MKKICILEKKINQSKISRNLVKFENEFKKSIKNYVIKSNIHMSKTNVSSNNCADKGRELESDEIEPTDSDSSLDGDSNIMANMNSVVLEKPVVTDISYYLTVSVAESVTAGALSNTLCSEPGSSRFFLGGIVAYNMAAQSKLLDVDEEYAEKHNFANPFTTFTMAKNVTNIFNSRIGLSTTGFSLPTFRDANEEMGKCEINIQIPYAYVCLYDSIKGMNKIYKIVNDDYHDGGNKKIQRAQMQSKIALECKKLFVEYCLNEHQQNLH